MSEPPSREHVVLTEPHRAFACPPVLQLRDVAQLLGFKSRRTVLKAIAKYRIPHVRLGRRVFVLRCSLLAFLKQKEQTDANRLADLARKLPRPTAGALSRAVERLTEK